MSKTFRQIFKGKNEELNQLRKQVGKPTIKPYKKHKSIHLSRNVKKCIGGEYMFFEEEEDEWFDDDEEEWFNDDEDEWFDDEDEWFDDD